MADATQGTAPVGLSIGVRAAADALRAALHAQQAGGLTALDHRLGLDLADTLRRDDAARVAMRARTQQLRDAEAAHA